MKLYYTILYHTILTILYYTILYYIRQYCKGRIYQYINRLTYGGMDIQTDRHIDLRTDGHTRTYRGTRYVRQDVKTYSVYRSILHRSDIRTAEQTQSQPGDPAALA